jgi:hypothetical protein
MKQHRRTAIRLPAAIALAALTACGTGTATQASSSVPSGPTPSGASATATPGSTRLCLSGTVQVLHPVADNPLRSSCVHVGTRIVVTLQSMSNYRWAPVTSSAPALVAVLDNSLTTDGTRAATAQAEAPGTATLTSADTYTPDPNGPPSRAWHLTLTVGR